MEEDMDNLQNMLQMMDMFQMFAQMNGQKGNANQPRIDASLFKEGGLDERISTPALRSIKAAIPYLEPRYQRLMGIMVKMIELQRLMEVYSTQMINVQGNDTGDWRRGMLAAIRPHMDKEKQTKIDMMLKIMDIKDAIDMIRMMQS